MSEINENKPPIWFWVVSVVALLWNLMGLMEFFRQMNMSEEAIAKMSEAAQAAQAGYDAAPAAWATAAFAVAVFCGALGCLLLVLRKRLAIRVLNLSLLGVIIQQIHWWGFLKIGSSFGAGQLVMPVLIPIISILLIIFARFSAAKNWLK
ncbi:MAG: hypothetical protein COA69_12280 [Robiginitomaculum sp.]|nr:MAG: hypothetical protein COA69_12280 [Robiginitomaculum sp.]